MSSATAYQVALLWHGDRATRNTATLADNRLRGVAEALAQAGITAQPAVYSDDFADEVREQLLTLDGVLVWVNPIENGRDRTILDAMLGQVADAGILVSAHPGVVQKMGTKEVLYRTRELGWGCDTYLYTSAQQFREQFPARLSDGKPRVLKQYRGNGGNGVWKVELRSPRTGAGAPVGVRHALRGSSEETITLGEFQDRCEPYFAGSGRIIEQAWQARLSEGMIRCYLVRDKVAGFGEQLINALYPAPPGALPEAAPQPGPRLYYPPERADFQHLKTRLEQDWLPAMQQLLAIDNDALPVIWDADFLYGAKTAAGEDTYVLCEINVSSVYPFPDDALQPLAQETLRRLCGSGGSVPC
jgi:hypothetical protein